jgi:hypothetical protein
MAGIWLTTAGQLCDGLEKFIEERFNPKTTKEWDECMRWLLAYGYVEFMGKLEDKDIQQFKSLAKQMGAVDIDTLRDKHQDDSSEEDRGRAD